MDELIRAENIAEDRARAVDWRMDSDVGDFCGECDDFGRYIFFIKIVVYGAMEIVDNTEVECSNIQSTGPNIY